MVARVRPSPDPFQCGPGDLPGDGPDHGPSPRVSQHLRRLRDIDPPRSAWFAENAPFWLNGAAQESNLASVGLRRRSGFEDCLLFAQLAAYRAGLRQRCAPVFAPVETALSDIAKRTSR